MYKQLILIGSIFYSLSLQATELPYSITGYAFDNSQAELRYKEVHYRDALTHRVNYIALADLNDETQQVFATKNINYSQSQFAPDILFSSNFCAETYKIAREDAQKFTLQFKNNCLGKDATASVVLDAPTVIDAGFDAFLKQKIIARDNPKDKVVFHYALPSHGGSVELKGTLVACEAIFTSLQSNFKQLRLLSDLTELPAERFRCVKVQPNNWFLSAFVDPLVAIYDVIDNKAELKVYRGKANFSDAEGKYPQVTIFYRDESE